MNRSTRIAVRLAMIAIVIGILVISCLQKAEAQDTCTVTIVSSSTSEELKMLVDGGREYIGLELDLGWRTMKIRIPVVDGQAELRQLEPFSFRFTAEEQICGQSGWYKVDDWYHWMPVQAQVRDCTLIVSHFCNTPHELTVLAEGNTYPLEWSQDCSQGSTTVYGGRITTLGGKVIVIKNGDYTFRLWESKGYGQGLGDMLYEVTVHVDGCNTCVVPLVFG